MSYVDECRVLTYAVKLFFVTFEPRRRYKKFGSFGTSLALTLVIPVT